MPSGGEGGNITSSPEGGEGGIPAAPTPEAGAGGDGGAIGAEGGAAGSPDEDLRAPLVLTQRYDNARSGINSTERVLNADTVGGGEFGKQSARTVRGSVHAQPLYVPDIDIAGEGRAVLYVATMRNHVYAFDATNLAAPPYWTRELASNFKLPEVDPPLFVDLADEIGIASTPVLSDTLDALYLVAATEDQDGVVSHLLHKLDPRTGETLAGPVSITAEGFIAAEQAQHSALLLDEGVLHVAFGAYRPEAAVSGWLFAFDSALQRLAAVPTTRKGAGGGITMSGHGLVRSDDGTILFTIGQGTPSWDAAAPLDWARVDLASALARVRFSDASFQLLDWFAPTLAVGSESVEVGALGPVLLPETKRIVVGGMSGISVLDRDALGFSDPTDAQVVQRFRTNFVAEPLCDWGAPCSPVQSTPVFWPGPDPLLFVWARGDSLRAFRFDRASQRFACGVTTPPYCEPAAVATPSEPPEGPGGLLSISSNGESDALLWAAVPWFTPGKPDGSLRAYSAQELGRPLWSSEELAERDAPGQLSRSVAPVVARGRVYIPTVAGLSDKFTQTTDQTWSAPALSALGDRALVMAWASTDLQRGIQIAWSDDARTFSQRALSTWTPYDPSLASDGSRLFFAWSEFSDDVLRVRVSASSRADFWDAAPLVERTVLGETIALARPVAGGPALTFGEGRLFLAFRSGVDGQLKLLTSTDGLHFESSSELSIDEATDGNNSPGLFFANGTLYLYWVNPDRRIVLLKSNDEGRSFSERILLDVTSAYRPAFAAILQPGRSLPDYALFWVDTDQYEGNAPLTVSTAEDADVNAIGRPFRMFTDFGWRSLTATTFRGGTYVAWTGPPVFNHPNVARYDSGGIAAYGVIDPP